MKLAITRKVKKAVTAPAKRVVKIPNEETLKALDEAVNNKNLTRYKSVDDMFKTILC